MQITVIDSPLTDDLLWRLDLIPFHLDNRGRNTLALGRIILEFKCHLVAALAGTASVEGVHTFALDFIVLDVVEIHFYMYRAFDLAVVFIPLLLGRDLAVFGLEVRLAAALLLGA